MQKLVSTLTSLVAVSGAQRHAYGLEKHYRANDVIMPPLADNSTYGNTEQIHTTHLNLDLNVDFDTRKLSGVATHTMNVIQATSTVQFDIWDLDINSVANSTDLSALSYTILQPNPKIGSVLQVTLPREVQVGEQVNIDIDY